MKQKIRLSVPAMSRYLPLALTTVKESLHIVPMEPEDRERLVRAARELIDNAIRHAYPKSMKGDLDILVTYLHQGIELEVHDMGFPFDFERHIETAKSGGLRRIYDEMEGFRFINKAPNGKSFVIFHRHDMAFDDLEFRPYSDLQDESPASMKPASIQIRDFQRGDEEAISRLIYNNYSYSYFKSIFYEPKKILALNEEGEIASVVAETKEGRIVGHFALIRIPDSQIAEIGVAVVDPDYKGMGIMNAMLDRIQQRARELELEAIFGEALMLHPFSQRANLRHGFGESALLLGLVPTTVTLTDPNAIRTDKRSAVLIGYKILSPLRVRAIHIPSRYRHLIETIYRNVKLEIDPLPPAEREEESTILKEELSPYTQTANLVIESFAKGDAHLLKKSLHRLCRKHVDMIFADVNLMRCNRVEAAVDWLKKEGFVFAGILFFRRNGEDYLRMQLLNAEEIETEKLVCHSDFCKSLTGEIKKELDEEV